MALSPTDLIDEINAQLASNGKGGVTAAKLRTVLNDTVNAVFELVPSNFVEDFGAVGDGATDNVTAMLAFNAFARAQSAAGKRVELYIPPGTYNYDGGSTSKPYLWLNQIRKLRIVGYGAIFQNTYSVTLHGANFAAELAWGQQSRTHLQDGFLINTVTKGSTAVILTSVGDASHFATGDWVMVGSYNIQMYGYPPNLDRFDFCQITSVSGAVINLSRALNYEHRSTFPDGTDAHGKARIYPLNRDFDSPTTLTNLWNIDHIYEGIETRLGPGSAQAFTISGRKVRFVNCIVPGVSPSVAGQVAMVNCTVTSLSEPDKLVESFLSIGTDYEGIKFQSSSVDHATFVGGKLHNFFLIGGKVCSVTGMEIDGLGLSGNYGYNRLSKFEDCTIRSIPFPITPLPRAEQILDFGADVTYSLGTIAIRKTVVYEAVPVIGAWVELQMVASNVAGPSGSGIVLNVREDATWIYVDTNLPATLPSWQHGRIMILKGGEYQFINCTGSQDARNYSIATARNKQPWEYLGFTLAGNMGASGVLASAYGILEKVRFNVYRAPTFTGHTLTVIFSSFGLAEMATNLELRVRVSLDALGVREARLGEAFINAQTGDDIKLAGSTQSVLPQRYVVSSVVWQLDYDPSSAGGPYDGPGVVCEILTDSGPAWRQTPLWTGFDGTPLVTFVGNSD